MEPDWPPDTRRAGVFVTLNYLKGGEEHLRGCIGFPLAHGPLNKSVVEAAIAAATQDPRFAPVDEKELGNIIFEVSVLTEPEELKCKPADYARQVRIGRDGLMMKWRHGSGLLLPQVPVELGWGIDEYLDNICYKAGAPRDILQEASTKLYTFQALVFKEQEPGGRVRRIAL
jgi:uncharacterized protein (TIGR00296 family)